MATVNLNDPLGTNAMIRNATMPERPNGPGAFQLNDGPQMTANPPVAPTLDRTAEPTIAQQGIQSGGQDLSSLVPGLTNLRDALGGLSAGQQQAADEDMVAGAAVDANYYGPEPDSAIKPQDVSLTDAEERAINRNQLRLYQSEIDATNRAYDQLLNEARLEGQGRIGSQRAIAARGGILGSDFAGAQKDKVQSYNTDIRRGLEGERAAKIGAIMGDVRTSVANEIARKTAAKRADADTWIDYLKNEKQTRQNNINALAQSLMAQGVDVNDLSEEELAAFATELGTTPDNIRSQYAVLSASQQTDGETFTLSPGQRRYNADGELIAEGKGEPTILKEGDVIVDENGNIVRKIDKTYKPDSGGAAGVFSSSDTQTLLGGGWSENEINLIDQDVRSYGLPSVISQAESNGATPEQVAALREAYGVEEGDSIPGITRESLASFYGLTDTDSGTGWFGRGDSGKSQLDALMEEVELYRDAGYEEKEILEMLLGT